jgi:hypothetical protein
LDDPIVDDRDAFPEELAWQRIAPQDLTRFQFYATQCRVPIEPRALIQNAILKYQPLCESIFIVRIYIDNVVGVERWCGICWTIVLPDEYGSS